jgi:hypothetical protein
VKALWKSIPRELRILLGAILGYILGSWLAVAAIAMWVYFG